MKKSKDAKPCEGHVGLTGMPLAICSGGVCAPKKKAPALGKEKP